MVKPRELATVLLLGALAANAVAARVTEDQSLLSTRVREFQFHGRKLTGSRGHVAAPFAAGLPEAALALAQHAQVRICIESLPWAQGDRIVPVELKVQNKTIGRILGLMVRQDPRYTYRERLGVIEVLPVAAVGDPADCLNTVIPIFRVRYPWKHAWASLRCALDIVSRNPDEVVPDPIMAGRCAGASHLAHPPHTLLDARFERTTVRDILDQLASSAGNVAWYAHYGGRAPTCQSLQLGEYQPRAWYPVDPDAKQWVEGLPRNCVRCHYHKQAESK